MARQNDGRMTVIYHPRRAPECSKANEKKREPTRSLFGSTGIVSSTCWDMTSLKRSTVVSKSAFAARYTLSRSGSLVSTHRLPLHHLNTICANVPEAVPIYRARPQRGCWQAPRNDGTVRLERLRSLTRGELDDATYRVASFDRCFVPSLDRTDFGQLSTTVCSHKYRHIPLRNVSVFG